jgi:hypothetical protein
MPPEAHHSTAAAKISERLTRFLEDNPIVESVAGEFCNLGDIAIFGGLVRDLARIEPEQFSSDIDLVVMCDSQALESAMRRFPHRRTKFGGYRFEQGSQIFDIWSAWDTWAVRHNHRSISTIDDIVTTTFFTCDQVIYKFDELELHYTERFVDWAENGRVALNLRDNPNLTGMVDRIVRMIFQWNLEIDRELADFTLNFIDAARRSNHKKYEDWVYVTVQNHLKHEDIHSSYVSIRNVDLSRYFRSEPDFEFQPRKAKVMSGGSGSESSRPTAILPTPIPKGSGGGGGGAGGTPSACVFVENTLLNSPNQAVIQTLAPGAVLKVELELGPPVRVVAKAPSGQIAGSLTGAKLPQLIECMKAGVDYQAQVTSIRGGRVDVRVSNK